MSAAVAVLNELRSRGITVEPRPNGNLYLVPKEGLTPELIERVRAAKPDLLRLLADPYERACTIALHCEATGTDAAERLASDPTLKTEMERDTTPQGWTPAHSILDVCQQHGVALRIDKQGDLVVGKNGAKADEPTQAWPSLLAALEAHLEPVARLLESGWHLRANLQPETKRAA